MPKRATLAQLVSETADRLLDGDGATSADRIVDAVLAGHERVVEDYARSQGRRLLRSVARATLRQRADGTLQQQELDLGVPDNWLIAARDDQRRLVYVLATEATEDDLIVAEREQVARLNAAEQRLDTGRKSAERAVDRARAALDRFRTYAHRLGEQADSIGQAAL